MFSGVTTPIAVSPTRIQVQPSPLLSGRVLPRELLLPPPGAKNNPWNSIYIATAQPVRSSLHFSPGTTSSTQVKTEDVALPVEVGDSSSTASKHLDAVAPPESSVNGDGEDKAAEQVLAPFSTPDLPTTAECSRSSTKQAKVLLHQNLHNYVFESTKANPAQKLRSALPWAAPMGSLSSSVVVTAGTSSSCTSAGAAASKNTSSARSSELLQTNFLEKLRTTARDAVTASKSPVDVADGVSLKSPLEVIALTGVKKSSPSTASHVVPLAQTTAFTTSTRLGAPSVSSICSSKTIAATSTSTPSTNFPQLKSGYAYFPGMKRLLKPLPWDPVKEATASAAAEEGEEELARAAASEDVEQDDPPADAEAQDEPVVVEDEEEEQEDEFPTPKPESVEGGDNLCEEDVVLAAGLEGETPEANHAEGDDVISPTSRAENVSRTKTAQNEDSKADAIFVAAEEEKGEQNEANFVNNCTDHKNSSGFVDLSDVQDEEIEYDPLQISIRGRHPYVQDSEIEFIVNNLWDFDDCMEFEKELQRNARYGGDEIFVSSTVGGLSLGSTRKTIHLVYYKGDPGGFDSGDHHSSDVLVGSSALSRGKMVEIGVSWPFELVLQEKPLDQEWKLQQAGLAVTSTKSSPTEQAK